MYAVQKRLVALGFTSRCAVPVLCDRAVAVGAALRLPFGGDDAIDQALRRIDLGAWHKDFHVIHSALLAVLSRRAFGRGLERYASAKGA